MNADRESLRVELADVKKELADLQSATAARDSEEVERNLSVQVSLRQKLQIEYDAAIRLFEEEKQALSLRCNELINTLALVDSERLK